MSTKEKGANKVIVFRIMTKGQSELADTVASQQEVVLNPSGSWTVFLFLRFKNGCTTAV